MKKSKWITILSALIVIMLIIAFHGYFNLKKIMTPPSELWGRNIPIGMTDYKKQPSITYMKDAVSIFAAKESGFVEYTFDKTNYKPIENEVYIPGIHMNKLVKYKRVDNMVFWTENDDLYMYQLSGNKKMIQQGVKDFSCIKTNGRLVLITAQEHGISVFKINDLSAERFVEDFKFDKPLKVSASEDHTGKIHIFTYNKTEASDCSFKYLILDDNQWQLKGQLSGVKIDNNTSVGNLQIGLDAHLTYLFYEVDKWDQTGSTASTYLSYVPFSTEENAALEFEKLIGDESQDEYSIYISDLNCASGQASSLKAIAIKDSDMTGSFKILYMLFKDGKLIETADATSPIGWIGNILLEGDGEADNIVYLQTGKDGTCDIWYVNSGRDYNKFSSKIRFKDIAYAATNSFTYYAVGVLIIVSRFIIFLPALFFLLIVEFFEIRKLLYNPKLSFNIALVLFLIIKVITMNHYYRAAIAHAMPSVLMFAGAKYLVLLLTTAIALFITKWHQKRHDEINLLPDFTLFTILDITFTCLLYSPYML